MLGLEDGVLIVVVILVLVALLNVGLIYGLLSGSTRRQIDMLRKAARRARNPWEREDRDLQDLHQRVSGFETRQQPPDENTGRD